MSYDVYWVKNRAEKIADFEHPTPQLTFLCALPQQVTYKHPTSNPTSNPTSYPTS